jgi:hypothetical protein
MLTPFNQRTTPAIGFGRPTDGRSQIKDCPIYAFRYFPSNEKPSSRLKASVISNIDNLPRTKKPFKNPSHVRIEQRLSIAAAEKQNRAGDVLSDSRKLLDFSSPSRKFSTAFSHYL